MKTFFKAIISWIFIFTSLANAKPAATYYRAWQGFSKPGMSRVEFTEKLTPFMQKTFDVYRNGELNRYIVVVPPANKPSFIPDELALVALTSETAYKATRSTADGKAYADAHWELFDKSTSKSAPMVNYFKDRPKQLQNNTSYDMIATPLDWTTGHTVVFIGVRKNELSINEYLNKLQNHIENVSVKFKNQGLNGYIVIANENYEIAYINWESKAQMEKIFASPEGKAIGDEAGEIMNVLMWEDAK